MTTAKSFHYTLTTAISGALLCSGCGTRADHASIPTAPNSSTAATANSSVSNANAARPESSASQNTARNKNEDFSARKTLKVPARAASSGTQYPFQVLGVSLSGGSGNALKELHYDLSFSRLPAENTLYDFYYSACTDKKTDAAHQVGVGGIADYLKMANGKIYSKVLGSTPEQNQYSSQNTVSGSIKIKAGATPRFLLVRMYEWHPNAGAGKEFGAYFVPVRAKP